MPVAVCEASLSGQGWIPTGGRLCDVSGERRRAWALRPVGVGQVEKQEDISGTGASKCSRVRESELSWREWSCCG